MRASSLTTTISTKGQVILPKLVRDQLQWHAGTRLTVEHTAEGVLLKPLASAFAPTRPEDVFGCLSYTGSPKSVGQINAGVAVEVERRHARLDTDIIVRYLVCDDRRQAEKARAVIGQGPVFVPRTVMLEVEWVLRGVYNLASEQVIPSLRALAGLPGVTVEDAGLVAKAMDWAEAGMDFADALHLAAAAACDRFLTFDKAFLRTGASLTDLLVAAL